MAFLWDKKLETGNGMIDQQHKQLITAINDLKTLRESAKKEIEVCDRKEKKKLQKR